jgi:hypothetical protein
MRSADLSPHAGIFQDIITVDDVQRYKPTPEVYFCLAEKVGEQKTKLGELWFASGNPFDITGAKNGGLRAGIGWRDRVIEDGVPDVPAKNLEDLMGGVLLSATGTISKKRGCEALPDCSSPIGPTSKPRVLSIYRKSRLRVAGYEERILRIGQERSISPR